MPQLGVGFATRSLLLAFRDKGFRGTRSCRRPGGITMRTLAHPSQTQKPAAVVGCSAAESGGCNKTKTTSEFGIGGCVWSPMWRAMWWEAGSGCKVEHDVSEAPAIPSCSDFNQRRLWIEISIPGTHVCGTALLRGTQEEGTNARHPCYRVAAFIASCGSLACCPRRELLPSAGRARANRFWGLFHHPSSDCSRRLLPLVKMLIRTPSQEGLKFCTFTDHALPDTSNISPTALPRNYDTLQVHLRSRIGRQFPVTIPGP